MFFDTRKHQIPGASIEEMGELRARLNNIYGVSDLQIVESVAFSMAMVVRSALGLHAYQASIGILYEDSLPGWIALATARHLGNAGCSMTLVTGEPNVNPSSMLTQLLQPLRAMKISELTWTKLAKTRGTEAFLSSCHNLVCGIAPDSRTSPELRIAIADALNDHSIPVHCIEAPPGLELNSGQGAAHTIYASSTLSLGVPYQGMATGHEWAGRHYLADISLPHGLISEVTKKPFPILFSEQPVIQIFPPAEE